MTPHDLHVEPGPESRIGHQPNPGTQQEATETLPPCPVTERPALRRLQPVSRKLLSKLWRHGLGIDVERLMVEARGLALYESECGLAFFHPRIEGDASFYREFYQRVDMHEHLSRHLLARVEYRRAAELIPKGARLLDVGCGLGAFRAHLPLAHFTGLDPFAPHEADSAVLRESLSAHADRAGGHYDAVTAFQVIEHLADPRVLVEQMLRLLKPGGLIVLCAPLHPSTMTRLPNFLLNAPPHHLTWWNPRAFTALANQFGLEIVALSELPPSPHEGVIHWMGKLCPARTDNRAASPYFAHRWAWHLSIAFAHALAGIAHRVRPLPCNSHASTVLFAGRKAS